jgi:alpha-mannosidase
MNYPVLILAALWFCPVIPKVSGSATAPDEPVVLWETGRSDNDNSEFMFAPNQFHLYRNPGIHVVGVTDPAQSWPYILPGPLDLWAGPGPHTFEIFFSMKRVNPHEDCRLVIDILDAHSFKPSKIRVIVNNAVFEHQFEPGNNDWLMSATDNSGREQVASFTIPGSALKVGENKIGVTATDGAWILWDAIRMEAPPDFKITGPEKSTFIRSVYAPPVIMKNQDGLSRPLILDVVHIGAEKEVVVKAGTAVTTAVKLAPGQQSIEVSFPENKQTEDLRIELISDGQVIASSSKRVEPVRNWEVHLIHQTHLDIGFTHTQEEVLEMQIGYLYEALDLIEKTRDYPEEARFKWHAEGMWAVDEFMRTAPEERKQQYIKALHDQSIHLDAFYVHLLTGLATGEELFELMQPAKEFERKYDVPVITAIGSDVPGYSWGLVTAMAGQGIKFLNTAPNNNHRLGYLYHHADQPFFWLSPCGQHKVLTWMASHAYIYFWEQDARLEKVPRFLEYLEGRDFPYDIAMLRYEVGGDNGYPDARLPDRVKAWNEKYAWPKIIISTNSRLYHSFIERYEDEIPVMSGDLTPYWEDGAVSTSADLAISRRAGERILQAHVLQSMLEPGTGYVEKFNRAWNNILMYDEHTWGAWSSISDPFGEFTVQQEEYKQQFALSARDQTIRLMKNITVKYAEPGSGIFDVYNTASWARSDLVYLPDGQPEGRDGITGEQGEPVPSQRLANDELVFWADGVPPLGARRYRLSDDVAELQNPFEVNESGISNGRVRVKIDRKSGSVSSIVIQATGQELVDQSARQFPRHFDLKILRD